MLQINEIYKCIQGESTLAGLPCILIRLTGCNLRCIYCDTRYAFDEGKPAKLEEILSTVRNLKCNLVEITGGEPLMQDGVYPLLDNLSEEGYSVMLETNGTIDLTTLSLMRGEKDLRVIMDIKSPGSGMSDKIKWENIEMLRDVDEIKFVISNRKDYVWAKSALLRFDFGKKKYNPILFSPVSDTLDAKELSGWILEDNLEVRLNLQLHKLIWGDARKV